MYHNLARPLLGTPVFNSQLLLLVIVLPIGGALSHQHHLLSQPDDGTSFFNDSLLNAETLFPEETTKCQPMQIPFCDRVNYNRTILPNFLGHTTQSDVISEINIYHPLVKIGCSPDLKLFLCTVYAPMCFDHDGSGLKLLPCQSLCETARQGCGAHLRKLGHEWPQALQCDKFPNGRDKNVLCVGNDSHSSMDTFEKESFNNAPRDLGFVCPKNFEVKSYSLHLNGKTYNDCAMPCEDVYLNKRAARVVQVSVGILAFICLASTMFTCVTFLLETKRFEYPARPIFIIAFCQLVVATCYLIGYLSNNRIACNEPAEAPKSLPNMKMIKTTTMGNKKGSCTLQFMALYFFQVSTMFWWLMMTISWYMIANLKWAPEAVSGVAKYFHLFSWTVPALLTISISALGDIEGDSLTGTCHVSVSNGESVLKFIIVPTTICLLAGCLFLFLGFKSIWESREILRRKYGEQTNEHYKLVIRIGLFSILVMFSSTLFIYLYYLEQTNQVAWKLAWLSNICKIRDYSIPCPVKDFSNQGPHYVTFILKYSSAMAVGIISATFMLSRKTISTYREHGLLVMDKLVRA